MNKFYLLLESILFFVIGLICLILGFWQESIWVIAALSMVLAILYYIDFNKKN